MGDTVRSYPFHAHGGEIQFIAENELNEAHVKYFMGKLIETFNQTSDHPRAMFENLLCTTVGVPTPSDLPELSEFTPEEQQQYHKEMSNLVETFKGSPIIVRDFFTRAWLETIGISIPPPEEIQMASYGHTQEAPTPSRIIQFPH
jgi:hypothetical protein